MADCVGISTKSGEGFAQGDLLWAVEMVLALISADEDAEALCTARVAKEQSFCGMEDCVGISVKSGEGVQGICLWAVEAVLFLR